MRVPRAPLSIFIADFQLTRGSRADALRILNVGGIFARSLCEPNGRSRDKDSK
jgi:hypothetical protein